MHLYHHAMIHPPPTPHPPNATVCPLSSLIQVLHHLFVIASSCGATESKRRQDVTMLHFCLKLFSSQRILSFYTPSQATPVRSSAPFRQVFAIKLQLFPRVKGSYSQVAVYHNSGRTKTIDN